MNVGPVVVSSYSEFKLKLVSRRLTTILEYFRTHPKDVRRFLRGEPDYVSERLSNPSRSITEPHVGHLAATCCVILSMRGEEGLLGGRSGALLPHSSQGCLMFIFVGRLGTIPLDLKYVTICEEMLAKISRALGERNKKGVK